VKLEMDTLWEHPAELAVILDLLATPLDAPPADVILGVPEGGQRLAEVIAKKTGIPLIRLERIPGGAKQDFRFTTPTDQRRALSAKSPRIYEDVVTTLSSVAGVVKLLDPAHQDIHAVAIWRRGQVKEQYAVGVKDHYLVEEILPSFRPENP